MPLDGLYALQATIRHLTRSSLHRCLQRHGISRLSEIDDDKPKRSRFKAYPLGYFHIDLAEVHTAEGRLYFLVAIDRLSNGIGTGPRIGFQSGPHRERGVTPLVSPAERVGVAQPG